MSRRRAVAASPWWLAVAVVALLLGFPLAPLQRLELLLFDLLAPSVPAAGSKVVVVAIDDASLGALGPWPWSRRVHARMVDRLRTFEAASVAYDVLFVEPSPVVAGDTDSDTELARAIRDNGRVILPVAPAEAGAGATGVTPLLPLPALHDAAHQLAHVDVELDLDAVARRLYLQAGVGATRWPALSLAAVLAGADPARMALPGRRASAPQGDARTWERDHEVLLPQVEAPVRQLSFAEVLNDDALAATLRDSHVLVGVTATGIADRLNTTLAGGHTPMAAVQFLAHAAVDAGAGRLITPLTGSWWLALLPPICAAAGLGMPRFSRRRAWWAAALPVLPLLLAALLLHLAQLWLDPLPAMLGLAMAWLVWRGDPLRETHRRLQRSRQQAHATLLAITDGVISVDADLCVRFANPAACRLLQRETLVGFQVADLFARDPVLQAQVVSSLQLTMRQQLAVALPRVLELSADSGVRIIRATAAPVLDEHPAGRGAVLALSDVTDAAVASARLDHEATHDALTGLPNRSLLLDRLRRAVAQARRNGGLVALLFIDLNRFKRVNDSLGHRNGDLVLQQIAQRLRHAARAGDTVARWGGDEFVLLLEGLEGREQVNAAARRLVDGVGEPIAIEGIDLEITCSVGIAFAPDDSEDPDRLLAMADLAMFRGKSQSGMHVAYYSAEMTLWTRDWLQLEDELRQALAHHEFELHYQPQIDLRDGCTVALEALLRWRRADGEVRLPGQFMAVAEDCGLIQAIGAWVIRETVRQLAVWQAAGLAVVPVAVNVSARQCLDFGLIPLLEEAIQQANVAPALLTLEITETAAMRDVDHVVALLRQVRALGIGVAVDDFGTGYTSLAYLKRFPLTQIKVDQSFVRDVARDHDSAAIVAAIIAMAHSLGLPVVAEGVEDAAQRDFLISHHCDLAQGYFYSTVLSAEGAASCLRAR